MSIKYRDKNGAERVLSGLTPGGDIEYGAVATRSGVISIPATAAGAYDTMDIAFSEELPDADYEINITPHTSAFVLGVMSKTKSGFRLIYRNTYSSATSVETVEYTAYKLYDVADAEQLYSTVLDMEAMIPSNASSTNKFTTADDLRTETRTLDRRLDDVEDVVPTSASITNKLVTQTDLSSVEIDKVEDINDVELTNIQDGQTLIWDDTNSKWVNGQGGKVYSAGDGINISNTDEISAKVDDTSITTDTNDALKVADTYKTIFVGTHAQWDALSTTDKIKYNEAHITDDVIGGEVADSVTDGLMSPVTSNAVYDALANKQDKTLPAKAGIASSVIGSIAANTSIGDTVKQLLDNDVTLQSHYALLNGADLNNTKLLSGLYGCLNCTNAPSTGIGTLMLISYSPDWIFQLYTVLTSGGYNVYTRARYNGTTWSPWRQLI